MSIGSTLSNAMSGLSAAAKAAELVSSNIANSMNPAYGRRELVLSPRTGTGGGVSIEAIHRHKDAALSAELRQSTAGITKTQTVIDFHTAIGRIVGTPGSGQTLSDKLGTFRSTIISASGDPSDNNRLIQVVDQAKILTKSIRDLSSAIQNERAKADKSIHQDVQAINTHLKQIEKLNRKIATAPEKSQIKAALLDQRGQILDKISEIIPIKTFNRNRDAIAIYTPNGQVLLETKASIVEFTPTPTLGPNTTNANGLSTLSIKNETLSQTQINQLGGRLGANFAIRDKLGPKMQEELDNLSYEIIEQFSSISADPTLENDQTGLFGDSSTPLSQISKSGLSNKIGVNPIYGDAPWKLREGQNSPIPLTLGDASTLTAMSQLLAQPISEQTPSIIEKMANLTSRPHEMGQTMQAELGFQTAYLSELQLEDQKDAVNTDAEMQTLIEIEQAFAANARVISVVDELIQQIIRI